MGRRVLAVVAVMAVLSPLAVLVAGPTAASGTAKVILVDRYTHGQIQISMNGVIKRARNGDRIGPFAVTPDSMGNDEINLYLVKHPGCGIEKIGYYFKAGHRFRVLVDNVGGPNNCHVSGRSVKGPAPHVKQLS
jgi:hypothetical protein